MRLQDIDSLRGHPRLSRARIKPEWLYTTQRHPIYWHHIAKNAGTFMKHLMYLLDHDTALDHTGKLHDWDAHLVRATHVSRDQLDTPPYGFIVLRNPFQRFLSVYFDKVYGPGGQPRPGIGRAFFQSNSIDRSPDLEAAGHIENCLKLAHWTADNIAGRTRTAPNWHLVPQLHQVAQVYDLNFRALTVEQLDWQLTHLLSGLIPDIADRIARVPDRNSADRAIRHQDMLVPDLKSTLKQIYADDLATFREARAFWRAEKGGIAG
ncbi:MAG: sulfotransferase family 2 domain-containing protein [Pseudomonadota bacterium]